MICKNSSTLSCFLSAPVALCVVAEVEKRASDERSGKKQRAIRGWANLARRTKKTCATFSHTYHCRGVSRAHPASAGRWCTGELCDLQVAADLQPTVNRTQKFYERHIIKMLSMLCVSIYIYMCSTATIRGSGTNPLQRGYLPATISIRKQMDSQMLQSPSRAPQKMAWYVHIWGINFTDSPAPIFKNTFL